MLLFYIKVEFHNPNKFKAVLWKYLCENSFYSLDEYFELQSYILTHDLNWNMRALGHFPFLYSKVFIINMSVYIQPLSVMKENFLLKEYL